MRTKAPMSPRWQTSPLPPAAPRPPPPCSCSTSWLLRQVVFPVLLHAGLLSALPQPAQTDRPLPARPQLPSHPRALLSQALLENWAPSLSGCSSVLGVSLHTCDYVIDALSSLLTASSMGTDVTIFLLLWKLQTLITYLQNIKWPLNKLIQKGIYIYSLTDEKNKMFIWYLKISLHRVPTSWDK